jgi:hypothetical protein
VLLDVIVLALIAAITLALGISLVALLCTRSSALDSGEAGLATAHVSFDDAIRAHLELKRRHAAAERVGRESDQGDRAPRLIRAA